MTKEQIIESGFIKAFIMEYFEYKIHGFYPDKDRLLYILCNSEKEKKEVALKQIEIIKAQISELGFEELSFAYLLSCKPESLHNYIEPNKRFDFWLQRFSEDFEDHITDFDPITKAIYLFNEVSELSIEVMENESEFWEWYPRSQHPKMTDLIMNISIETNLLLLIDNDIEEYYKNEYWEFYFEEYERFIDVSKPIELLFNLSELLVQLHRLENFNELLEIVNEALPPQQPEKPKPKQSFKELVEEINNAFFRLESFMNGTINNYHYFGFNDAFTRLFSEAKKTENFTYDNCKLIGRYWNLTEQTRCDYDISNFKNSKAYENDMFCKDCDELMYLNYDRIEEFTAFSTPDEVKEMERKFSITDILTPSLTPQQTEKPKPEQYEVLSSQITHPKRTEIAEAIKGKYRSYKGKDFKILYEALLQLDLFPKKGKRSLFFRCLQNESYSINNVQMLEDKYFKTGYKNPKGTYEKSEDEMQRDEIIEYLKTIIETK